ncbi:hypothetical protein [Paramuribaculum intestinale]|uniref:hypothetical protein n=1 Tax=Paramuribaculum intestinale TaxID=2094151 RepID=UPI0025B2B375|nr:hypothetical protein [Paramuribaculum intestinale]
MASGTRVARAGAGRLISHAPQLGRVRWAALPPVYASRSPASLTHGGVACRSEPGIASARTLRGSEGGFF